MARDDLLQVNGPNVYALAALCLWSSRWIENLESVILYPIISCFIIVDTFYAGNYSTFVRGSLHRRLLYVGNIHQTIVDCFVLEAFREYREDLRDHMSDNTQNRPKSELRKTTLSVM